MKNFLTYNFLCYFFDKKILFTFSNNNIEKLFKPKENFLENFWRENIFGVFKKIFQLFRHCDIAEVKRQLFLLKMKFSLALLLIRY